MLCKSVKGKMSPNSFVPWSDFEDPTSRTNRVSLILFEIDNIWVSA